MSNWFKERNEKSDNYDNYDSYYGSREKKMPKIEPESWIDKLKPPKIGSIIRFLRDNWKVINVKKINGGSQEEMNGKIMSVPNDYSVTIKNSKGRVEERELSHIVIFKEADDEE